MDNPTRTRRLRRTLRVLAILAVAGLLVRELTEGSQDWAELALFTAIAVLLAVDLVFSSRANGRLRDAVATEESRYRFVSEQAPVIAYLAEIGENAPWHYVSPHIT